MGLSKESKLKEVTADPRALEILEKYIPGCSEDKRMKLMAGLTLTQLQPMSGGLVTPEMLEQIDAELRALGD
ncbi:MAG: hypothetical protein ACOYIK_07450 [Coriobacteriales bacterium]